MFYILSTLLLLLAFLDVEFTKRRLWEEGIDIELNPVIRFLCRKITIDYGVPVGVIIPTFVIIAIGWCVPDVLPFMLGVRFCLFLFQCQSRNDGNETP